MNDIIKMWVDPHDLRDIHGKYYEVGGDVVSITEHRARGEGDDWYYDVEYADGSIIREFHPSTVIFAANKT